ncbi:hypothetical protein AMAG_07542 [Allomyces macrogynus ATCC 38327]|uniref:Poly A polymerase head domain-containing protein n=1 Tax=Allomyces macrogynus (strain ATCC 38327) TaxID=578462 RepID=A0A0L0SIX3_ALLM3|nr:hypothetical protein AMAG_07542 [Allomyces macrogynus ATCC 38327]|eukprot:KNE62310.1 hypothetical protein AMAG_07542 [Allomyces macrogynus ATCC 38327]
MDRRPTKSAVPATAPATLQSKTDLDAPMAARLALTTAEQRLFALLNDVCKTAPKNVVCRVAGGWVRDKLLGHQSDDLDIALDSYMGFDFASLVATHLNDPKRQQQWQSILESEHTMDRAHPDRTAQPFAGLAKILANPDKSKHLETATARVLGMDVDFVNLRSETYHAHSRIPATIAFGTPKDDALRRDCTINALFYNIATSAVEDFTDRGLADLAHGIIRTPLDPRATFHDDPLRVLRAVRFAARLGFTLAPDLQAAANDPELHDALANKISKERIGTELHKMLAGPGPAHAVAMLHHLGVLPTISLAHVTDAILVRDAVSHAPIEHLHVDLADAPRAVTLLHWLATANRTDAPLWHVPRHESAVLQRYPRLTALPVPTAAYLATVTLPFHGTQYRVPNPSLEAAKDAIASKKAKRGGAAAAAAAAALAAPQWHALAHHVVRSNFKQTNHDADWVAHAHAVLSAVQKLVVSEKVHVDAVLAATGADPRRTSAVVADVPVAERAAVLERLALGRFVRFLAARNVGETWAAVVAVACVHELVGKGVPLVKHDAKSLALVVKGDKVADDKAHAVLKRYHALIDRIYMLQLDRAWVVKPILNGNDLLKLLNLPKGPLVKDALDWVGDWQLAFPQGNADACRAWLERRYLPPGEAPACKREPSSDPPAAVGKPLKKVRSADAPAAS